VEKGDHGSAGVSQRRRENKRKWEREKMRLQKFSVKEPEKRRRRSERKKRKSSAVREIIWCFFLILSLCAKLMCQLLSGGRKWAPFCNDRTEDMLL
jgi:hypothetical protein